ncbi:hypothetical protein C9994_08410 [Marivirga lumbricoides]|uniref:Uncharacterized protein n=1 Tax=Marivirga lumbricoides TaxID=1046115 RepID=A0A2T4DQT8_9BACT|nr:hypothetical protein C9994_08410 [Marivirga lumbricoides]
MKAVVKKHLNVRLNEAHVNAPKLGVLNPGEEISISHTIKGQSIEGNNIWCVLHDKRIIWSGGLSVSVDDLPGAPQKYVLATADDYGVYDEIDEGIEHALKNKWINSVAVLVNKDGKDNYTRLERLRNFLLNNNLTDKVHVGLHFTFASGKPLESSHKYIINRKGFFRNPFFIDESYYDQKAYLNEVKVELTAQLDKFKNVFGKPDHFTSHFDTHTFSKKLFEQVLSSIDNTPIRNYHFIPKHKRILLDVINTASFPSTRKLDKLLLSWPSKKISDQTIVSHYGPPGFFAIWNYARQIRKKRDKLCKHVSSFYSSNDNVVEVVYHLIKYGKLSQRKFRKIFKAQKKQYPHLNPDYFDGRVAEFHSLAAKRPWDAFDKISFLPKPNQ